MHGHSMLHTGHASREARIRVGYHESLLREERVEARRSHDHPDEP